ncbi:hypothetical protein G9C98_003562 [Cotesia typhae]|uniref:Sorting nexin 6 n=1 Tax=Cotesia typhae TaxID=2053667 RepID=A0A8J5UVE0_9HYME|nr:hypothetical protein G9C98_003562 [Cotesia typhae]
MLQDGICDNADILNSTPPKKVIQADNVDLTDKSLQVDISDALSEKDKVKFTIPPCPPRPDFDASREKLQKLGEGEGNMTREEFTKMKQELEAEYLATFKKTVAMHEMFLTRLAHHPVFRNDHNLRVFLEYDQDLCVRGKNKIEIFGGLVKSLSKTTDEYYLSATVKDVNDFFDQELTFLHQYHNNLKEATTRADRQTTKHKDVADSYIKISTNLLQYYMRDTAAAKRLLFRRLKALHAYETANRTLEKARARNKDVHAAEKAQTEACEKFEQMSDKGKEELTDFKTRRIAAFRKNLIELTELEIKHAKTHADLLKKCLLVLREE